MTQGSDEGLPAEKGAMCGNVQQKKGVKTIPVAPTQQEFGLDIRGGDFTREQADQKTQPGSATETEILGREDRANKENHRNSSDGAKIELKDHQGFGAQPVSSMGPSQKRRILGPSDSLLLTIRCDGEDRHECDTAPEASNINVPDVVIASIADSPAIQLGDPTLSMVNEFIDYETVEKQRRLKSRSFWRYVWRIFTCGTC